MLHIMLCCWDLSIVFCPNLAFEREIESGDIEGGGKKRDIIFSWLALPYFTLILQGNVLILVHCPQISVTSIAPVQPEGFSETHRNHRWLCIVPAGLRNPPGPT